MATLNNEQLWAPWRLGYIKGDEKANQPADSTPLLEGGDPDCFLCRAAVAPDRPRHLVVARGRHTAVVLNRYPYNNGHLLVAPLRHWGRLDALPDEVHLEAMHWLARLVALFEQKINAEGFNIGLNLGRTAGAGLPGHLHWHLVPRWNGDTNFMPVLAGVKVIPQSLDSMCRFLAEELSAGGEGNAP